MCLLLATSQKSSRHQVEMEARSTARDCQRGNCTTSQDDSLCQGCPWCENGSLDCCRERSKTLCPVTSWRANHVSFFLFFLNLRFAVVSHLRFALRAFSRAAHSSFFLTNDNHRNESIVFEADCKTTRTSSDFSFSYTFFSCSNNNNNKH